LLTRETKGFECADVQKVFTFPEGSVECAPPDGEHKANRRGGKKSEAKGLYKFSEASKILALR
jgi:hypothetical protein